MFQHREAGTAIKAVYLFGSAVRGQLHKDSDIDLFVECEIRDGKRVEQLMNAAISRFIVSKDFYKWKLLNFTYPFSVQTGKLEEWDLKESIASESIALYSQKPAFVEGERSILFVITLPTEKKKYIRIRRLLFGRDETFYRGTGIIVEMRGEKLGSNVFRVPQTEQGKMMGILSKEKIDFSMKELIVMGAVVPTQ